MTGNNHVEHPLPVLPVRGKIIPRKTVKGSIYLFSMQQYVHSVSQSVSQVLCPVQVWRQNISAVSTSYLGIYPVDKWQAVRTQNNKSQREYIYIQEDIVEVEKEQSL